VSASAPENILHLWILVPPAKIHQFPGLSVVVYVWHSDDAAVVFSILLCRSLKAASVLRISVGFAVTGGGTSSARHPTVPESTGCVSVSVGPAGTDSSKAPVWHPTVPESPGCVTISRGSPFTGQQNEVPYSP
jgi:hypothetical protein